MIQKVTLLVCLATVCCHLPFPGQSQAYYTSYKAAMDAYEKKDYPVFLAQMQLTDSLRPEHPTILYNLAVGYALNDRPNEGITLLERALWMNATLPFEDDKDLASLRALPAYALLQRQAKDLNKMQKTATVAITLGDSLLHPEGVAFDPRDSSHYLGSIRQRKILKVKSDGETIDFAVDSNLWAIMGLQVDSRRNLLWACSTAAPEMLGYNETLKGKAQIVSIDLKDGSIEGVFACGATDAWLGDLILLEDGTVLATSSSPTDPAIYRVNTETKSLEVWLPLPSMISLQGITVDDRQENLYIADYRHGIQKVSLATRRLTKVENHTSHPLKGIDGLYFHKGALIGIHNGLRPFRTVKYRLDEGINAITGFDYLDKALPEYGEPTLGTIIGDQLHYVANSPWGAYDKEKKLKAEDVTPPIVLKTLITERQ